MLGSMSRSVKRANLYCTDRDLVAVAKLPRRARAGEIIPPLGIALGAQAELGAGFRREHRSAGEKISVDMRLENVRNIQFSFGGCVGVDTGFDRRIDDDRLPGFLAGDQITGLREILVVEALKDHPGFLPLRAVAAWTYNS